MFRSSLIQNFFSRYLMVGAIFFSAYLLFQVQPMIAKYILPWFGGSAAVWTICMIFFQAVLLFGYAYSHFIVDKINVKFQSLIHAGLLCLTLFLLPISPDKYLQQDIAQFPVFGILLLLSMTIGLPYFILTTTSSLIQSWYAKLNPTLSPYPLYALSNVASIFALLSYPILVETNFILSDQTRYWSIGLSILIIMLIIISLYFAQAVRGFGSDVIKIKMQEGSGKENGIIWFMLAATASILLLSVSDHLSRDVASVPFIWVLPLTIYLLSFILCFESDRWYSRNIFSLPFFAFVILTIVDNLKLINFSYIAQIILYSSLLFNACMICHGELVKGKPSAERLTKFYLIIAFGGVVGGLYVGVIAPLLFSIPIELFTGLMLILFIYSYILYEDEKSNLYKGNKQWVWLLLTAFIGIFAAFIYLKYLNDFESTLDRKRNFYGSIRVKEEITEDGRTLRTLIHGTTNHGIEIIDASINKLSATTYYSEGSAIGQILNSYKNLSINMGMVGLGIGTVATYLKEEDHLKVYEINPQVTELANKHFNFLRSSKADVEVLHGDGRLLLEREINQNFNVLVIDAFSGDAIPVHLLTNEAIATYDRHLTEDGILAFHTSNNYLDLRPVIYGIAEKNGFSIVEITNDGDELKSITRAQWFLLTKNDDVSERINKFDNLIKKPDEMEKIIWTDDFSNIFSILK